jgi:hypothetical protein
MKNGFWIWRNNLPGILLALSDISGYDFDQSDMDAIHFGLTGTSDEKSKWFDYELKTMTIQIANDQDDTDIIHIRLGDNLDDKLLNLLNLFGTAFEIKIRDNRLE